MVDRKDVGPVAAAVIRPLPHAVALGPVVGLRWGGMTDPKGDFADQGDSVCYDWESGPSVDDDVAELRRKLGLAD